jgi:hypothetical protein
MTYKNNYQTAPMAQVRNSIAETYAAKETSNENSTIRTVKSVRRREASAVRNWVVAGIIMAILMPIIVYMIGSFGVAEIASFFTNGLASANSMLAVMGSSILGALLVYGFYRIGHKEPDRETSTNPAWAFKYAKRATLVHLVTIFAATAFTQTSHTVTQNLGVALPGLFNTVLTTINPVLSIAVVGVLAPIAYETVVSNLIHRNLKKSTNGSIATVVHAVLTFVAYAVVGGPALTGIVVSILAALAFNKYNHATYPASMLVASNILNMVMTGDVTENAYVYIIVYIVLTVVYRFLHKIVCKVQANW